MTLIGDGPEIHVMELVSGRTEVVHRHADRDDHYGDVHGSAVLVGNLPLVAERTCAAAIIDLPNGRERIEGEAVLKPSGSGFTVRVSTPGGDLEIRALCRPAEQPIRLPNVRRHLSEV